MNRFHIPFQSSARSAINQFKSANFGQLLPSGWSRATGMVWSVLLAFVSITLLGNPALAQKAAEKPVEKAPAKKTAADDQKWIAETDAFFKDETIHRIEITIAGAPGATNALEALVSKPREYVKATVTVDKKVYPNVGVHLRGGLGSFRPVTDKAGFTINMDKFDAKETFHGMDKWHLVNSVQDGSYVAEMISNEMLRAAGVPATRIQHAIVTLNGQVKGFYALMEGYDSHFMKKNFGKTTGNLYDGGFFQGGTRIWQRDIDNTLQRVRNKDDVTNYSDLKALVAASKEPDPKKRWEQLEKLLDVDSFISGFCIQAILGDWDGYVFHRCNYRVYHDPERNKIFFLPAGLDQVFGNPVNGPLIPPMQGMVAIGIIKTPEGKARYLKRMEEINTTIMDTEKWLKRLDEIQARIQPALTSVDPKAGAAYPNQIKRIRDFFVARPKSIERQLKTATGK